MFSFQKTAIISAVILGLNACDIPSVKDDIPKPPISSALDLGRRIEILASDNFEGRAPGTTGGISASQYIAEEMEAIGLTPMGKDGSYFQPVELTETKALPGSEMIIFNNDNPILSADQKTNAVFWTKQLKPSIEIESNGFVFVGYGIVAPEYGWDDYEGLDVTGKTVVMFVNDPGFATQDEKLFKGNSMTYYGRWTYKFEEAGRQGAAAALIIHETKPASYGWDVVSGSWTGPQQDLVRPDGGKSRTALEGWLHYDAAKDIFKAAGQNIESLKNDAQEKSFKPVALESLSLSAKIDQDIKTVTSRNVVGAVKGTKRPDEYVLYMAHWDHLGANGPKDGDHIYNGAVDNATGTAAILEIGEAFVQQGAPERSALFLAVTAEESGLLGSSYYAADPIVPLKDTVAGINIDGMLPVGRTKDIIVIGNGASELEDRLEDILSPRDMYLAPDMKPEAGFYYRSDHISLAKHGVPMIFTNTGQNHITQGQSYGRAFGDEYTKERYHKPADEYDHSWDLSGIEETTEILFRLGYYLANSNDWPNWYEGSEFKSLRDKMRPQSAQKE